MISNEIKTFVTDADRNINFAITKAQTTYRKNNSDILSLGSNMSVIMAKGQLAQYQLAVAAMAMMDEQKKAISVFEKVFRDTDKKLTDIKNKGIDVDGGNELIRKLNEWKGKFNQLDVPGTSVSSKAVAELPSSMSIIYNRWSTFNMDPKGALKQRIQSTKNDLIVAEGKIPKENKNLERYKKELANKEASYADDQKRIEASIIKELVETNKQMTEKYKEKENVYLQRIDIAKQMQQALFKGKYRQQIDEIDAKIQRIENDMVEISNQKKVVIEKKDSEFKKLDKKIHSIEEDIKKTELTIKNLQEEVKANKKIIENLEKELEKK